MEQDQAATLRTFSTSFVDTGPNGMKTQADSRFPAAILWPIFGQGTSAP